MLATCFLSFTIIELVVFRLITTVYIEIISIIHHISIGNGLAISREVALVQQ